MANVNKDALVDAISKKTDLSKKDVETVIDSLTEEITMSIKSRSISTAR